MQPIILQIHKLLIKKQKTLAVAESCTGGLAGAMLTSLSGSSRYFLLGITAYQDLIKQNVLKIPAAVISRKGAVSEEVAQAMARSVRKIARADFGIGITGIAGPTGAAPNKPVGTVWIAVSGRNSTISRVFLFRGNRSRVREQAALKSLTLLKTLAAAQ